MSDHEISFGSTLLDDYVGQNNSKNRLREIIQTARNRGEPVSHLIFSGPTGSGRRTLASAVATELGVKLQLANASKLKLERDLLPYLTNCEHGSFLVISELEKVPALVRPMLESSLAEFRIEIVLGEGANARPLNIQLQPFTCVSITSNPKKIGQAIVQNSIYFEFEPYSIDEAIEITCRKFREINLRDGDTIDPELLREMVQSVHGSVGESTALIRSALKVSGERITRKSFQLIGHPLEEHEVRSTIEERKTRIKKMNGIEFERFVATLFSRKGYSVEPTAVTGDHGIDIRLSRSGTFGVVQCKQWLETVGEQEIRDFYGAMCHENAEFGFFVAGAEFSRHARVFSRGKRIELVDIHDLTEKPDWYV